MSTLLALVLGPRPCPICGSKRRRDLWREVDSGLCVTCAYEIWRRQYGPIR